MSIAKKSLKDEKALKTYISLIEAREAFIDMFEAFGEVMEDNDIHTKLPIMHCSAENLKFAFNPFFLGFERSLVYYDVRDRILKFIQEFKMERSTIVLAYIYTDRFFKKNMEYFEIFSVEMILKSSLVIAQKYNEEFNFSFKQYADAANVTTTKMAICTNLMLKWIDFQLYVNDELFKAYDKYNKKFEIFYFLF